MNSNIELVDLKAVIDEDIYNIMKLLYGMVNLFFVGDARTCDRLFDHLKSALHKNWLDLQVPGIDYDDIYHYNIQSSNIKEFVERCMSGRINTMDIVASSNSYALNRAKTRLMLAYPELHDIDRSISTVIENPVLICFGETLNEGLKLLSIDYLNQEGHLDNMIKLIFDNEMCCSWKQSTVSNNGLYDHLLSAGLTMKGLQNVLRIQQTSNESLN